MLVRTSVNIADVDREKINEIGKKLGLTQNGLFVQMIDDFIEKNKTISEIAIVDGYDLTIKDHDSIINIRIDDRKIERARALGSKDNRVFSNVVQALIRMKIQDFERMGRYV